jgi:hypothetical protein
VRPDRRYVVAQVLIGLGLLIMVVATWARLRSNPVDAGSVVLAFALVALVIAWVALVGRYRTRTRHRLLAARPVGWRLHEVWADGSLGEQLARVGIWEKGFSRRGGARLTLSWSPAGVGLWSGTRKPREVISAPWSAVASLTVGQGIAAATPRPAVVVVLAAGATLVVVPAARAGGGLFPASSAAVAALVADLRAVRDVADGA